MQAEIWLMIALALLMGLAAVGVVLAIKIQRRRQGASPPGVAAAVPVRPMSDAQARRMQRRYLAVALVILAGLGLLALSLSN